MCSPAQDMYPEGTLDRAPRLPPKHLVNAVLRCVRTAAGAGVEGWGSTRRVFLYFGARDATIQLTEVGWVRQPRL